MTQFTKNTVKRKKNWEWPFFGHCVNALLDQFSSFNRALNVFLFIPTSGYWNFSFVYLGSMGECECAMCMWIYMWINIHFIDWVCALILTIKVRSNHSNETLSFYSKPEPLGLKQRESDRERKNTERNVKIAPDELCLLGDGWFWILCRHYYTHSHHLPPVKNSHTIVVAWHRFFFQLGWCCCCCLVRLLFLWFVFYLSFSFWFIRCCCCCCFVFHLFS